jgi:hypothetical protein
MKETKKAKEKKPRKRRGRGAGGGGRGEGAKGEDRAAHKVQKNKNACNAVRPRGECREQ